MKCYSSNPDLKKEQETQELIRKMLEKAAKAENDDKLKQQ